jgi:hypothetical protein
MFTGCKQPVKDAREFLSLSESARSGFSTAWDAPGFSYSLRYLTPDYFAAREFAESPRARGADPVAAAWKEFGPNHYFIYSVRAMQGADDDQRKYLLEAQARALINELPNLPGRIFAVSKRGDTLSCVSAQLQTDLLEHAGYSLLIAFRKKKMKDGIEDLSRIIFRDLGAHEDRVEFDAGSIRPRYSFAP